MKVILQQDIRGKGKRGQMIEVAEGYGRNYLLPRKLAVEANADNVNTLRMNDKALAERQAKEIVDTAERQAAEHWKRFQLQAGQLIQAHAELQEMFKGMANR